jgi:hypothetical protein
MDDFSKLTPEQRKNAPAVSMVSREISLGKVKQNGFARGSFVIKNTGASPLVLLKAFSDCNCIKVNLPKRGIAAHKEEAVKIEVATGISLGQMFETLNLITNSPSAPSTQVHVSWETVK